MVNESEQTTLRQGLPETLDELQSAMANSLSAFMLGAAWATWISRGVNKDCCPVEHILFEDWRPEIFEHDREEDRAIYCKSLYQFLLRGLLRDCAQFVEVYMKHNGLVPKGGWSEAPVPVHVLRIFRNGFNHDWTIGKIYKDVEWEGISFKCNVGHCEPPAGWRQSDPILDRFPKQPGAAELVGLLINDILDALRELSSDQHTA